MFLWRWRILKTPPKTSWLKQIRLLEITFVQFVVWSFSIFDYSKVTFHSYLIFSFICQTNQCFTLLLKYNTNKWESLNRGDCLLCLHSCYKVTSSYFVIVQQPWPKPEPIWPPRLWTSSRRCLRFWLRSLWWRRSNLHWDMLLRWAPHLY